MENTIKLPEAYLKKISALQTKFRDYVGAFGTLYMEKLQLDKLIKDSIAREEKLQSDFAKSQEEESALVQDIIKEFGEGQLDIKNGVFIPDKK